MTSGHGSSTAVTQKTSAIIDVLASFDAYTIVNNYQNASKDPDRPTFVDNSLIYMTTRQDRIIGQSGAELNVKARVGDVIRWRETELSLGFEYDALFYRFVTNETRLITPPQVIVSPVTVLVPQMGHEGQPVFDKQTIQDHYWQCTIVNTGHVTYHFYFGIYESGSLLGYFQWDPFITIEPKG